MATLTSSAPQQQASPKNQNSVLPIVLLAVVFFGALFFVKPLWDDVGSLSLGRDDKMQQRDQLSTELQHLQTIQQSMNEASEVSRQTTLNAIPQRLDQDKLITDLTTIAKTNDIILNSVTFSINAASTEKIKRATMNANLTGNLSGLLDFLKGVEANARKMSVKTVSVQTGTTDTGIPRVNFNINLDTYYLERI
ncbi:MAG: type 4a pilus biogenesis protein PilO [Candidatus Gracilibacteria bacterium]